MKKAYEEFSPRVASVSLKIRREAVQVHDDHLEIELPCKIIQLDLSSLQDQLENTMSIRDAARLTDEIGEDLFRKLAAKALSDLIV